MSGLRINYEKSEVMVIGVDSLEQERVAHLFNCEVGSFPMKYLGVPISHRKLLASDFDFWPEKIRKKLGNWHPASSGGRKVLIDACLDNIPNHIMGFYLLSEGTHYKADMIRASYFWEGNSDDFKYHMVRWANLCRPKQFGGLGFVQTRIRNVALLAKWIMKLERGDKDLSCQILAKKYLGNDSFFNSDPAGSSQFWKGLHAIKNWVRRGIKYQVGNGRKASFWSDVWFGEVPLRVLFPTIFQHCSNPEVVVAQVLRHDGLDLGFRRSFGVRESQEWSELQTLLGEVSLSEDQDIGSWALNSSGAFSSKSLYLDIMHSGVIDARMVEMWKAPMPLKVKIFVWMCFRGRIQAKADLCSKGWPGDPSCRLCGELETAKHIIFGCPMSHFNWWWVKEAMGWEGPPLGFDDFKLMGLKVQGCKTNYSGWAVIGALCWAIWLARNDLAFNGKISSIMHNNYHMISLLSQWTLLVPAKHVDAWKLMVEKLKTAAKTTFFLSRSRGGIG